MKLSSFIFSTLVLTICTGVHSHANAKDTSPCQVQSSKIGNLTLASTICIQRPLFQPILYGVKVNDQIVYAEPSNLQVVVFTKQINEGLVTGQCHPNLQLYEMADPKQPVKFSTLSDELVAACSIKQDEAGNSLPFEHNKRCSSILHRTYPQPSFTVLPVEVSRRCSLSIDQQIIFDANFE